MGVVGLRLFKGGKGFDDQGLRPALVCGAVGYSDYVIDTEHADQDKYD
ncbi:MAG: hypothetical protein Q8L35_01310 [Actinomycetota bacterium]|nr:hypothetical protein [Actinomycetota bacterium]